MRLIGDLLAWTLFFGLGGLGFAATLAMSRRAFYSTGSHTRASRALPAAGGTFALGLVGAWLIYVPILVRARLRHREDGGA